MPMITFEGDPKLAADLYPEKQFGPRSLRGDVAITNMSRPQKGLLGVRLQESEEFGPTGEEAHGANILGRFVGDLDLLMKDINEGDIVYIRQARPEDVVETEKEAMKPAEKAGKRSKTRPVNKSAKKPAVKKAMEKRKGGSNGQ